MQQPIQLVNQIFDLQSKIEQDNLAQKYERNFQRLFSLMEQEGYLIKNPLGEKYTDARTDCEINIVGKEGKNMVITKVIKPAIYKQENGTVCLIQKAVVIIEQK
jgi:hypothetical protein